MADVLQQRGAVAPATSDRRQRVAHAIHRLHNRAERLAQLARAAETEVVPRLLLVRPSVKALRPAECPSFAQVTAEQVAELVQCCLDADDAAASRMALECRDRGVPIDRILLDLVTPAARELGELWNTDRCDFTQVTIGTMRLQRILRELNTVSKQRAKQGVRGPRVLFSPLPGEHHTLGLAVVAEVFRRAGFDAEEILPVSVQALLKTVESDAYAVIGFSIGREAQLDELARIIPMVRRCSRHRNIGVIVGGPVFVAQPELGSRVGADACAQDAESAVLRARELTALIT